MADVGLIAQADRIISNLRRRNAQMALGFERGLKSAGLLLLRESQRLVPVNFGVLKASGFMRTAGRGFRMEAHVGYTAAYAIYVHENVEMKLKGQPRPGGRGRFWDPQGRGQAKFLEEPARRLVPRLRNIIREGIRA